MKFDQFALTLIALVILRRIAGDLLMLLAGLGVVANFGGAGDCLVLRRMVRRCHQRARSFLRPAQGFGRAGSHRSDCTRFLERGELSGAGRSLYSNIAYAAFVWVPAPWRPRRRDWHGRPAAAIKRLGPGRDDAWDGPAEDELMMTISSANTRTRRNGEVSVSDGGDHASCLHRERAVDLRGRPRKLVPVSGASFRAALRYRSRRWKSEKGFRPKSKVSLFKCGRCKTNLR